MKKFSAVLVCCLLFFCCSCNFLGRPASDDGSGDGNIGILCLKFRDTGACSGEKESKAIVMPDTNAFILNITNARGISLYSGAYSKAPESILAEAGNYDIRVVSRECSGIEFDAVQWGDEQCVSLQAGKAQIIELICRQINSGIKLGISPDFLEAYPDAVLFLKNNEGRVMYAYSEKRTAFFNPGPINLIMSRGANEETIFSRNIGSGEILDLAVKVAQSKGTADGGGTASDGGSLKISVDTLRTHIHDNIVLGEVQSEKGASSSNAFTISQAKAAIGSTKVWVGGYIVGGDLTSKSMSVTPPFTSPSCLAIGPKASTTSKESCIAVQLSSGSKVRSEINLLDNPDMYGRYVLLQGDIVASYYGIVGMKNIISCIVK